MRNYESDAEGITKKQKLSVEKTEAIQAAERKAQAKKLKADQVSCSLYIFLNM